MKCQVGISFWSVMNFLLAILYSAPADAQETPQLILPLTHSELPHGEFSSDGKRLLTYSDKLILWDANSARSIRSLDVGTHVYFASFCIDEKFVVATDDKNVRIIDTRSWKDVATLKGHTSRIIFGTVSKNKKILATVSDDNRIITWDLSSRRIMSNFTVDAGKFSLRLALNQAGTQLIVAGRIPGENGVQVRNASTGRLIKELPVQCYVYFMDVDNDLLTIVGEEAYIINLKGYKVSTLPTKIDQSSFAVNYSGDLFDGSELYNRRTMTEKSIGIDLSDFKALDFTNDSILISSNGSGEVSSWNINTGSVIKKHKLGSETVKSERFIRSAKPGRVALIRLHNRKFELYVFDSNNQYLLAKYNYSINQVTDVEVSESGDSIVINNEQTLKLWNSKALVNIPVIDLLDDYKHELKNWLMKAPSHLPRNDELEEIDVDWKHRRILTLHRLLRDSIKVIDIKSGNRLPLSFEKKVDLTKLQPLKITRLGEHEPIIVPFSAYVGYTFMRLSDDQRLLFTAYKDESFAIWDVATQKLVTQDTLKGVDIIVMKFHPSEPEILMYGDNDSIYRYNYKGRIITAIFGPYSDDVNWILNSGCTAIFNEEGILTDLNTKKILDTVPGVSGDNAMLFSADDRLLAFGTKVHDIIVRDVRARKNKFILKGHEGEIISLKFCKADSRLVSSSTDNTVKIWNLLTGRLIATFILFGESDYLVVLPSGYYMGTKVAVSYLSFRYRQAIFPAHQFDLRFNRPDKVLAELGSLDKSLINNYERAYKRRLNKFGLTEIDSALSLHLPELRIISNSSFSSVVQNAAIQISVESVDHLHPLQKLFAFVNDVPVSGSAGIDISVNGKAVVRKNIKVELMAGLNKVEFSCLNAQGLESLKQVMYINYQPTKPKPAKLYFIGIGVSRYVDSSMNLDFAAKDIQDLDSAFRRIDSNYTSVVLSDNEVTKQKIINLRSLLMKTSIEDKVIVSMSGHGLIGNKNEFYFATHDIDFKDPGINGLNYTEIEKLLDGIPARRKLLLLDACHSGELDDGVNVLAVSKVKTASAKGVEDEVSDEDVAVQNSYELMKELFSDLSRNNGTIVISAAGGLESAFEDSRLNNGVFTYYVKEAISENAADLNNDGETTILELKKYVSTNVEKLTRGRQRPTARREILTNDWTLWNNVL
jgi:WD40 repeat protein